MLFSLDTAAKANAAIIFCFLLLKINKISFVKALHRMLAFLSASLVLAKGIQLEVAIQDSQVDIKQV